MTTWSTKQLALALNLSPQRVGQLVKAAILPKPSPHGHDPFTAIPRYLAYLERPAESTTLSEARKKKVEVETKIRLLELRRRESELVERSCVERDWFALTRATKDNMLNIPSRVSGLCAAETDQHKIHTLLTAEITQSLEQLTHGKTGKA